MSISKQAILEIAQLSTDAERLARGSSSERKQADILCQRISTIKLVGLSSLETRSLYADALVEEANIESRGRRNDAEHRRAFDNYLAGRLTPEEMTAVEKRDFLSGTQTITWTQGASGGYSVPFFYNPTVFESMSQVDEVLDPDVTSFEMADTPYLLNTQLSGYDLSTVSGSLVGETVQQTGQATPPVLGSILQNNLVFKASFAASMEVEQDVPDFGSKIVRAASVALARVIGQHVVTGRGYPNDIDGIISSLTSRYTNATSGKITLADIEAIYFGTDVFYRRSPKAGWLLSDGAYKMIRNAVDSQNRPLLSVVDDKEMLMGKPIHFCPSLANAYSSIGLQGALIFGALDHIVVKAGRLTIQRTTQQIGSDITKGECLFVARCRADAELFDPSSGSAPPLILATIN
jgi:HK97 family phage major capsid protein